MPISSKTKGFKLFRPGPLKGVDSLSIFHAAAELGMECVIITSPASRFASTGYFDNARAVLNQKILKEKNIPVFRRRIGGGLVLLDPDQVFYQVVLKRDNPVLPRVVKNAYRKFSEAPIEAFRQIGVKVEYRPINDLVVCGSGAKISGQGAGAVEDTFVFAGNLLIDFNYTLMSEIVNLPDEKRGDLLNALKENVTNLTRELGFRPNKTEVEAVVADEFKKKFAGLEEAAVPEELLRKTETLSEWMTSDDFVFEETGRVHEKIKIREGVYFDLS